MEENKKQHVSRSMRKCKNKQPVQQWKTWKHKIVH